MKKVLLFLILILFINTSYAELTKVENIKNQEKKLREYILKNTGYKEFSDELYNLIDYYSNIYKVEKELIIAVIKIESNFMPMATSPAGAKGLMQLMPQTANYLGIKDEYNIDDNIKGGAMFLKHCLEANNNDLALALASYNAGLANVKKYDSIPPFEETQQYVIKVIDIYNNLSNSDYSFNNVEFKNNLKMNFENDF